MNDKDLFDMVYRWGRVGLVVDYMAPAFQQALNDIRIDEANRARTLIWGIGFDKDPTALQLRNQLFDRITYLKRLNAPDLTPDDEGYTGAQEQG